MSDRLPHFGRSTLSINLVVLGLAVAASPLPILVAVLMMASSQKVRGAFALASGWFISIGVSCGAVMILGDSTPKSNGHPNPKILGLADIAFGLLVGFFALREWRKFKRNPDASIPKWLDKVGSMSIVFSFGLGLFLPPTVIAFAAGSEIARQQLATPVEWIAVLVFAVIGSVGVFTPILIVATQPSKSRSRLSTWQKWLQGHWQEVLVTLFAVIAGYLVVKGLWTLNR
ncbi:Glycolipid exporter Gap/Sap [Acidimicrobiia bacterium]